MSEPLPEYIGTARIEDDGTIVLDLVATDGRGAHGIGQLRYPPDHRQYRYILDHIGPLEPKKEKLVRPFPAQGR